MTKCDTLHVKTRDILTRLLDQTYTEGHPSLLKRLQINGICKKCHKYYILCFSQNMFTFHVIVRVVASSKGFGVKHVNIQVVNVDS